MCLRDRDFSVEFLRKILPYRAHNKITPLFSPYTSSVSSSDAVLFIAGPVLVVPALLQTQFHSLKLKNQIFIEQVSKTITSKFMGQ